MGLFRKKSGGKKSRWTVPLKSILCHLHAGAVTGPVISSWRVSASLTKNTQVNPPYILRVVVVIVKHRRRRGCRLCSAAEYSTCINIYFEIIIYKNIIDRNEKLKFSRRLSSIFKYYSISKYIEKESEQEQVS